MFIKTSILIVITLFSFPLYAESEKSEVMYLDQRAIINVSTSCTEVDCYFPGKKLIDKDILVIGQLNWNGDNNRNLIVHTKRNIAFEKNAKIIGKGNGSIILKAGMEPGKEGLYDSTVIFEGDSPQIEMQGEGKVKIYYNPVKGNMQHKYRNPNYYYFFQHVKVKDRDNLFTFELVNNISDLQGVMAMLSGDYALSQNIDATEKKNWNGGRGFEPLKSNKKHMPFSGDFDGNNYVIKGLFINHPEEDEIGMFGSSRGFHRLHNTIENLTLEDFDITGNHYVGSLAGSAINSDLLNIKVINPKITSINVAGGLIGTTVYVMTEAIQIRGDKIDIVAEDDIGRGLVVGGATESKIVLFFEKEQELIDILRKNKILEVGNKDDLTEIYLKSRDNNYHYWFL